MLHGRPAPLWRLSTLRFDSARSSRVQAMRCEAARHMRRAPSIHSRTLSAEIDKIRTNPVPKRSDTCAGPRPRWTSCNRPGNWSTLRTGHCSCCRSIGLNLDRHQQAAGSQTTSAIYSPKNQPIRVTSLKQSSLAGDNGAAHCLRA